jgi:hypothetical protein
MVVGLHHVAPPTDGFKLQLVQIVIVEYLF